jgi:SAM-dependent methyltransferase
MRSGYDAHPDLPALYDSLPLYASRADIDFYVDLCRQAASALELGCGTGRVLIPAAEAGCTITGLDDSEGMLAQCRRKLADRPESVRARAALIAGDMTNFDLGRTFPLITIPFRPFQHLTGVDQQLRCLECVRRHLAPQGRLAFDFFHPDLAMLAAPVPSPEIEDTAEAALPGGATVRRAFRIVSRDIAAQVNHIELIYYLDGRRMVQSFRIRYFFRYEVEHLLARAGFQIEAVYGNFDRTPFTADSPEMIFVASPTTG